MNEIIETLKKGLMNILKEGYKYQKLWYEVDNEMEDYIKEYMENNRYEIWAKIYELQLFCYYPENLKVTGLSITHGEETIDIDFTFGVSYIYFKIQL